MTGVKAAADAPAYFRDVMLLSQPKIKGVEELPTYTAYFFTDDFPIDPKIRAEYAARLKNQLELMNQKCL